MYVMMIDERTIGDYMSYLIIVNFKNGKNENLFFNDVQDVYKYVHKYADSLNKVISLSELDKEDLEFRFMTRTVDYINNQVLNNH